ncbi:hypothetical protein QMG83_10505 [Salinibacterium sp. G-O1]|uniref:hypothetical protein n=1 Tax=Salinibacterium sp. G-O1 TaxID=3046208 RepID=UPI0024BADC61|nr:hypothetical protein [Salinibacterium sp. G-O1]MDJ0335653.1 hypothetical protein [Salinibacterium sp. G-O1]
MIRFAKTMTRPAAVAGAIAITASLMLSLGAPLAATAATPTAEYSRDGGATWSTTPPSFLFASAVRYVPGDVATANLLIRSLRSNPTFVQLSLTNASTDDTVLDEAMTIEGADAAGKGLQPTRFSALTACQPVVPDRVMTQGQIVSVSLTLRVSPMLTGNQAQDAAGHVDLAVALSDPGLEIAPNGCSVDAVIIPSTETTTSGLDQRAGSDGLAYTGGTLAYPAFITAAIALGVGWLFVILGRRRRRTVDR